MQEIPHPPAAIIEPASAEAGVRFETLAVPEAPLPTELTYLDETVAGVYWDAKYAGSDNFTGGVVDGYGADRVAVTRALADGLARARDLAAEDGLYLLIWDAVRPQRAVDCFVRWAQAPEDGRTKAAHYPNIDKSEMLGEYVARRSKHSRGAAVDLTLVDETGAELDMGTGFDMMDQCAHHGASGLTQEQTANRKKLKKLMRKAGFTAYDSEWWHYALADEPYPDTYFDFEIGGIASREGQP